MSLDKRASQASHAREKTPLKFAADSTPTAKAHSLWPSRPLSPKSSRRESAEEHAAQLLLFLPVVRSASVFPQEVLLV
jgi:hypothetical protein